MDKKTSSNTKKEGITLAKILRRPLVRLVLLIIKSTCCCAIAWPPIDTEKPFVFDITNCFITDFSDSKIINISSTLSLAKFQPNKFAVL